MKVRYGPHDAQYMRIDQGLSASLKSFPRLGFFHRPGRDADRSRCVSTGFTGWEQVGKPSLPWPFDKFSKDPASLRSGQAEPKQSDLAGC